MPGSTEYMVKNTFIHFSPSVSLTIRRHNSEPSLGLRAELPTELDAQPEAKDVQSDSEESTDIGSGAMSPPCSSSHSEIGSDDGQITLMPPPGHVGVARTSASVEPPPCAHWAPVRQRLCSSATPWQ